MSILPLPLAAPPSLLSPTRGSNLSSSTSLYSPSFLCVQPGLRRRGGSNPDSLGMEEAARASASASAQALTPTSILTSTTGVHTEAEVASVPSATSSGGGEGGGGGGFGIICNELLATGKKRMAAGMSSAFDGDAELGRAYEKRKGGRLEMTRQPHMLVTGR